MIFSEFTKIITSNAILFSNESPIENVGKIIFYKDNAVGVFIKKEFRWSFNKNYWSSWMTLSQNKIISIVTGNNKYLFLEIKYIPSGNGTCSTFSLTYNVNTSQTYAPLVEGAELHYGHTVPNGCNN